jgi:hypothetical protein
LIAVLASAELQAIGTAGPISPDDKNSRSIAGGLGQARYVIPSY